MVATTPTTTTDRSAPRSIAEHWIKNNVLAAILAGVVSVCLYGVRQATGAADGSAGSAAIVVHYIAAVGLWAFWGAASSVLTGVVLQRIVPRLPVWTWIGLHVAGAVIVGVGLEMAFLAAPRDAVATDDTSLAATLTLGLMLGAVLGAVAGTCEALVLRRVAFGTPAWIVYSTLGFAVSWSFTLICAGLLGLGTDFVSELVSDVLALPSTLIMALIMLPALKRLKSSTLSAVAQHFS
jgi:hypothetical protein